MFVQLNPSIPVEVVGKGSGECIAWLDYGPEHDLLWLVFLDSDGTPWLVPNYDIRALRNYSLGRNLDKISR